MGVSEWGMQGGCGDSLCPKSSQRGEEGTACLKVGLDDPGGHFQPSQGWDSVSGVVPA